MASSKKSSPRKSDPKQVESPEIPPEEIVETTNVAPDDAEAPRVAGSDVAGPESDEIGVQDSAPMHTSEGAPESTVKAKPRGYFFPIVLGGAVAAGIGFAAAYYVLPQDNPAQIRATLRAQQDRLTGLKTDISGQLAGFDTRLLGIGADTKKLQDTVVGLRKDLDNKTAALSGALDASAARLDGLKARILKIEKRPVADAGGAAAAAVAAYEGELKSMRTRLGKQRVQIEKLAADATKRIADAQQQATELAKNTQIGATEAKAGAAISRIQAALETGAAFGVALNEFTTSTGQRAPQALLDVAKGGVPTLADLTNAFPAAARAALKASRKAPEGQSTLGALGTFLKSQTGARSLIPRLGTGPDAVLSRAEENAREGKLEMALTLIKSLPEQGQAAMANWVGNARVRIDALATASHLTDSLTQK